MSVNDDGFDQDTTGLIMCDRLRLVSESYRATSSFGTGQLHHACTAAFA